LAVETRRAWLKTLLRLLEVDRHVRIHTHIRPGSAELNELFLRPGEFKMPLANDTSCGVGYAPLDALEKTVLETERQLNAGEAKTRCPALGEDIKVMGVRRDGQIDLTIACAMVAGHVRHIDDYLAAKAQAADIARETAMKHGLALDKVAVNAGDGATADSLYLTVTGTSAESGDDGEVGRGNRINGLISFYRPMSMEAAAGKNPVSHVGKLYNLLAHRLAHALVEGIDGAETAYCYLLGQIGRPIDQPAVVDIRLKLAQGCDLADIRADVQAITANCLGGVRELWRDLVTGGTTLF
jgi:S-adenosylmethionine synthetase